MKKQPSTILEIPFHPLRKAYRDLIPLATRKRIEPPIAVIQSSGLPYFKRFMAKTLEMSHFSFEDVWKHLQTINFIHNP